MAMPPTEDDGNATNLGIAMPEDLTGLSEKDLNSLRGKIAKEFDKLNDQEDVSTEEIARMSALADALDAVDGETNGRAQAAADRQAARKELADRVHPAGEQVAEDGDPEAPAEPEAPAPAEPEAPAPAEPEAPAPAEPEAPAEEETPEEQVSIAASSRRAAANTRPRGVPAPVPADRTAMVPSSQYEGLSIVAASDIPGTSTGAELDREGLSEALRRRARSMSDSRNAALVASLSIAGGSKWDASEIKDDAELRSFWETRTDPESLVASGGWCAPSETIYDFVCDFECTDGLLDLPTVSSTRGGLRWPTSPTLKDVLGDADSGFTWTEANDIAAAEPGGPTKPCFVIPCPDFDEVRLQAQGICVTAGNLTDRAYPELTNRYVDLVMAAHAHRINGLTIAKVVASSTAVAPVPQFGTATAILGALELQIQYIRDAYFMCEDAVLEVVLPRFVRGMIRQDLAKRAGGGSEFDLYSNAEMAEWFQDIGASVQFVSDWQMLSGSAPVNWPTSVLALIYPAGTHSKLTGGVIDLGVVRDSTLNATNDYTAAWTEEFWQVATRGCVSLKATIPLCADGVTTAPHTITCPAV